MNYYNLGVLAGIIVGLIVVALVKIIIFKKDIGKKDEYDERQELLRNRGFKYAYFSTLIGLGVVFLFKGVFDFNITLSYSFMISTVLFLSLGIYVVYCIMHDAYFSLTSNRTKFGIMMTVLSLFNLASGIIAIVNGHADIHSESLAGIANLECGLVFLAAGLAMFIKNKMDKKEEEE